MEDDKTMLLVEKAQNGDISAFEQLVIENEKMVYNIAYRMLSNLEDAKDVSQDVFIKAYRNLSRFQGGSAFTTWLYRITVNSCIDTIRKRKIAYSVDEMIEVEEGTVQRQIASPEETPEQGYLTKERRQEVQNAIERLTPEYKTVLCLRDLQGLSYAEISEITEISLGTVKSRIARARIQLKNLLIKEREHSYYEPRQTM